MKTLFLSLLFASAALAQLSPISVPNAARLTTTTPVPGRPVLVEGGLVQGDGRGTGGWYIVTNISGTNIFAPAWIAQTGGLLTGASSLAQLQDLNWYPLARRHAGQVARLTTGAEYTLGDDLTSWFNTGRVASMAQLRLIEPGFGGTVAVDSYYGDGQGGGGTYFLTNTITGTNAYGGRVLALGGAKSWEVQGEVNILQFGAKPDETYNSQPHIQAALDYMKAKGGGTVWGKLGVFALLSPLVLSDAYGVQLKYEAQVAAKTTTNSFVLQPLGTNILRGTIILSNTASVYAGQGNTIDGVFVNASANEAGEIWCATNTGWGAGIILDRVSYSTIKNCVITRTIGPGIYVGDRGCSAVHIENNRVELCGGSGMQLVTLNDSIVSGNIIGNNAVHLFSDETQDMTSGMVFDSAGKTVTLTSGTWDTSVFSTDRRVTFYTDYSDLNRNVWDVISIVGAVMTLSQAVTDETIPPGENVYVTPMGSTDYGYGIYLTGNNCIVMANHVFQTVGHNIYTSVGRDNHFVNNRADGPTRANFYAANTTRALVHDNYFYDGGIMFVDAGGGLRDPLALRQTYWASSVYLGSGAIETSVQGNELNASYKSTGEENAVGEQYYGIYDLGKSTKVRGNIGNNNKHSGYWGEYAVGPEITGNTFQFNVERGIYLYGTNALPAVIKHNNLAYNAGGIVLDEGASAIIDSNQFLHASRIATTIRSNVFSQLTGQQVIYPTGDVTNFTVGEPIMLLADRGIWLSSYIASIDSVAQSLTLASQWRSDATDLLATAGNALQTCQMVNAVVVTADAGSAWMIGNEISQVTAPYSNLGSGTFIVIDSVDPTYEYLPNIRPFGMDIVGDSMTTSANKARRLGVQHYNLSEEPLGMIFGNSTSSTGPISIGGGTGKFNAATLIGFYSAANNTTTTGTEVARLNYSSSPSPRDSALQLLDRDTGTLRQVAVTNLDVGDGVTRAYLYLR